MGWWKINSVEKGGIACDTKEGQELYNGDGPADLMGEALDKIAHEYQISFGRYPKREELLACFNFCSNPFVKEDGSYVPFKDKNGNKVKRD